MATTATSAGEYKPRNLASSSASVNGLFGRGVTAKTVQARMLCLTHNLMTLMEQTIEKCCGLRNEVEFRHREKREAGKSSPHSSARLAVQRLTQRTVKFIRWLRNHLDLQRDWDDAIAKLAKAYSPS